jgi:hypothetical protein
MTSINTIQARPFQLSEPIGTTDQEITVKNFFDIYGQPIVMSGSIQYATLEPRSQDNQEIISYTQVVQLTTTQFKLTGVARWLDAQPDPITGLYGSDPSQAKTHSANAEAILSDNPQVWDKKPSKDEDEEITAEWTFDESPIVPTPTDDFQAAPKSYVDNVAVLWGADASTTLKGIARLSASPNVTVGTFTVTIATPAVFTKATHGLTENDTVQFTTTGALPTGLLPSTTYYVIAAGLTANDFQVSATYGWSAIATSGSQSGVHTAIKTTPVAVGTNDTRMPTQSENDALVGTSGTPSTSNPFVTDEDPRFLVKPEYFPNTSYPAWETLSAWNVVFIEPAPTTAQATSAQNIGDVTANTRISFPVFGSGVAGTTLKLNLAKVGSPSVNLWVRIETDNAGSPSGTLVNANATGTVTAASLTTSLADTTVTLWGSFTIPAGQKCHAVVFQWTYGSETVNASNYYKIGYYTNDSTTRFGKVWNGAIWVWWISATDASGDTFGSWASTSNSLWYRILCNNSWKINFVVKKNTDAVRCVLKSDAWATLATATFSGNIATFTSWAEIYAWTYYRVECDNSGGSYTYYQDTTPSFPTWVNISYNTGSNSWANTGAWYNIESINSGSIIPFAYTSSTLFSDRVLSKTDADFTYKIDWLGISQEAVTAGDLATGKYPTIALEWVDSNQSWLTPPAPAKTTYYLGNTPWAISSSAGTNSKKIGAAITASKLQIYPIPL